MFGMGEVADIPFAWPVGSYIREEIEARRWTTADLAARMGGDPGVDLLCVEMLLAVHDKDLTLDRETAEGMGRAFDVDPEFLLNLDRAWRERGPDPANANRVGGVEDAFAWPIPALSGREGAPEVEEPRCVLEVGGASHGAGCLLRMSGSRRLVAVLAYDRAFEPDMAGRLGFTLAALDDLRRQGDAPRSAGVVLCRGVDPEAARLALMGLGALAGVTDAPEAWRAYEVWTGHRAG